MAVPLTNELRVKIYDLMVKTRVAEERMIRMTKAGESFFWIGGPGEEGFNVPLGLLVKKGEGLDYDYLYLHYRSTAVIVAMGTPMLDLIRQAHSVGTDPFTGGRNFLNHPAIRKWNVPPVTSTIQTQFSIAPGTAMAQKQHGGTGITIVTGGDAGTSEADFATALIWSTLPNRECPLLMIITNNNWGISTPASQVHQPGLISRRAQAFKIRTAEVDGNDPEASWTAIQEAMEYVRAERRPYLIETHLSRLYGHSSASGANRVQNEVDCNELYKNRLIEQGILTQAAADEISAKYLNEVADCYRQSKQEPKPDGKQIYEHIYAKRVSHG